MSHQEQNQQNQTEHPKKQENFGAANPSSGSAIQTADLVTQQPPLQTLSSPRARLLGFLSPPGAEGLSVEARQTSPALRESPPGRERQAAAAQSRSTHMGPRHREWASRVRKAECEMQHH